MAYTRDSQKHANYMRDYMAKRRAEAETKGICKRCITKAAKPGLKLCQECQDYLHRDRK